MKDHEAQKHFTDTLRRLLRVSRADVEAEERKDREVKTNRPARHTRSPLSKGQPECRSLSARTAIRVILSIRKEPLDGVILVSCYYCFKVLGVTR